MNTSRKVNECRIARIAEILSDFRILQLRIAAAPTTPECPEDVHTVGWAVLRQCAIDARHILDCAADIKGTTAQGEAQEMTKSELRQCVPQVPHRTSSFAAYP